MNLPIFTKFKQFITGVLTFFIFLIISLSSAHASEIKSATISKPDAPKVISARILDQSGNFLRTRITFELPLNNGGAKITRTRIFLNGKSACLTSKMQCDVKLIPGTSYVITVQSGNSKGFGSISEPFAFEASSKEFVPVVDILSITSRGSTGVQELRFKLRLEDRYVRGSKMSATVTETSNPNLTCTSNISSSKTVGCTLVIDFKNPAKGDIYTFRAQGSNSNGIGSLSAATSIVFNGRKWLMQN